MQDGAIGGGDIHMLISILADGEEQARQLGEAAAAATADESSYYRGMARQLQCTFARAMAVARAVDSAAATTGDRSDSPRSADESSARTATDGGVAVAAQQERQQDMSKRRKGLPRWTEKFRVPDANLEATPDDGFSWRKYGQKDILGAKFPRGYYRCTYRNAQGCPATKQVQRSDADLAVFDVTYHGAHTCHQKQRHVTAAAGKNSPPPPPEADPSAELLVNNFKHGLKVETNGLAPPPPPPAADNFHDQQFCFPSVQPFHDDAGGGGFTSPAFVSPAGSSAAGGSSYFSVDHCYGGEPRGQFVMSRGDSSELHEVVSAATSTAAAAVVDPSAAAVTVATAGGGFVVDYPLSYLHHAGGELVDDPHLPFPPLFSPASMYGQYRDA